MKKTIIRIAAAALLVGGLMFNFGLSNSNSDNELVTLKVVANTAVAQGEINPDCPNGCVSGNTGCYCFTWYEYREASH